MLIVCVRLFQLSLNFKKKSVEEKKKMLELLVLTRFLSCYVMYFSRALEMVALVEKFSFADVCKLRSMQNLAVLM